MPRFDAASAECLVFTHKEGLLSAVAHDLMIRVTRFEIDVDAEALAVSARFEASSLRVVAAMAAGAPREGALSDGDKQKIERNIVEDVLEAKKHPEIRFASTKVTREGSGFLLMGDLTLHGRTRSIAFPIRAAGDRQVAEVTLHQADYGIKPYSAMLGAIKITPDVVVSVSLPWRQ